MLRSAILASAAALTLTACGSSQPTKALPPEFIEVAMEAGFAETIADECGPIRYNTAYERKVLEREAAKLNAAGYTSRDLNAAALKMKRDPSIQRRAISMVQNRNIDVTSERSWCRAGQIEIRRKTSIGRYLVM